MSARKWLIRRILLGLALAAGIPVWGTSQTSKALPPSVIFPVFEDHRTWHYSLGLQLTSIPKKITEEFQFLLPAIHAQAVLRVGPPSYLEAGLVSQILQNQLFAGYRYGRNLSNRFSLSVADRFAGWFGVLQIPEFNVHASGWTNSPQISLGYRTSQALLLTTRMEADWLIYAQSRVGGQPMIYGRNQFQGWSLGVFVDQPVWANHSLSLGLVLAWSKFEWQAWSQYVPIDQYLFYPQMQLALLL